MTDEMILARIHSVLQAMDVPLASNGKAGVASPDKAERPLSPDLHLVRDLDLDSLNRIELVIRIENEFRVILEPEDEEEVTTLGDLLNVIRRRSE